MSVCARPCVYNTRRRCAMLRRDTDAHITACAARWLSIYLHAPAVDLPLVVLQTTPGPVRYTDSWPQPSR